MRQRRLLWLVVVGFVLAASIAVWLVVRPSRPPRQLLVGFDDDSVKWTAAPLRLVKLQRQLGADAVHVAVPWSGEATPSAAQTVGLQRVEQAAGRIAVVLAVYGFAAETPRNRRAQERFCGYASATLALVPDATALVVWNETNSPLFWNGSADQYELLLARCHDRLHARQPNVQVLDSTAAAHSPVAFLTALAAAYRASGRRRPLVDGFGHNPYPLSTEQPAQPHRGDLLGEGDYRRLVATLRTGFSGTAQRSLAIWYLEDGYQTRPPAALRHLYSGHETTVTLAPEQQAQRIAAAIALAACQPLVHAFFNFQLTDERRLAGWQSGLLWPNGQPKPAAAAFTRAADKAEAGHLHCRP